MEVSESKKYLEEVMGIVEDEEFNRKRKLKAFKQKQPKQRQEKEKIEIVSDSTWCGTKVTRF